MEEQFALSLTALRLDQVAATLKWLRGEMPQHGGALGSALLAVRSAQVVIREASAELGLDRKASPILVSPPTKIGNAGVTLR